MRVVAPLIVLLALTLSGLAAAAATELRVALHAAPATLDPKFQHTGVQEQLLDDLFEGLVRLNPDGTAAPGMAQQWQSSGDHRVWTFILRENACWSDGVPVTAEDFVYAWRRVLDQQLGASALPKPLMAVVGAEALSRGVRNVAFGAVAKDRRHLEVTLEVPIADFPQKLAVRQLMPVPTAVVEEQGLEWVMMRPMVSNGPYNLVDWPRNGRLMLEKSPSYWAANDVRIDKVQFIPIESDADRLRRFRTGELDIAELYGDQEINWVKNNLPDRLRSRARSQTVHLTVNVRAAPWSSDANVRRALSLAIDRDALMEKILGGLWQPTSVYVPDTVTDYRSPGPPKWPASQSERDLEAKRLWALPGPARPQRIRLSAVTSDQVRRIVSSISYMWKRDLGVEIDLDNVDYNILTMRELRHDFVLLFDAWTSENAINYLDRFRSNSNLNAAGYASRDFDALLAASEKAPTPDQRIAWLAQAETVLLTDQPIIPLGKPELYVLISARVKGFEFGRSNRDLDVNP